MVWFTRCAHLNASSPCLGVCVDGPTNASCKPREYKAEFQSYMSWATDPLGDWSEPVLVYNGTDGSNGNVTTGDTNLAPVIYPNGSLVGLWRGDGKGFPNGHGGGIFVVQASDWKDPATYDFGHVTLANSIMGFCNTSMGGE